MNDPNMPVSEALVSSDSRETLYVIKPEGKVVGFIDLGTNSARLLLVRIMPNHSYTVLSEQKESVRLGEGEFKDNRLQPEAMRRAALVCTQFAEMARAQGASEVHAVATAACREARNKNLFIELLRVEAGLDLRVISGEEEARLIYLGVASGINLGDKKALFVDIGGGSTELISGNQNEYDYLDSLKLGAIRLTNMFFHPDDEGAVSSARYAQLQRHVRNTLVRSFQRLKPKRLQLLVGSSGTMTTLAHIAAREHLGRAYETQDVLPRKWIRDAIKLLCSLPLKDRRKVPGINPNRADIIVAGAAVADTIIEELDIAEVRVSERGMREGLLLDYLSRHPGALPLAQVSIREQSVLRLGRSCGFDEVHGRTVARLALEMFDSLQKDGFHDLGASARDLINYAALLHDIGTFLSYHNHQMHSYYFIRNAELLGFDQTEISVMAAMALFHRKPFPTEKQAAYAVLDDAGRRAVRVAAVMLRLAECLDRTHSGLIRSARFRRASKKAALLIVESNQECPLELWGVQNHEKAFKKAFGAKMLLEALVPGGNSGQPKQLE